MYFQPYGDEQQLNLNWIINEIINLHKQLDPDYETPSFTQVYPYSNLNRLNLDWILSELKALKELAPEPAPPLDLQAIAEALVALPFDSNTSYQIYDFISRDGEIWRATQAIAAGSDWDETKWFKTKIGTDLAVLERWINAINNSLTAEIEARQSADMALENAIDAVYIDVIKPEDWELGRIFIEDNHVWDYYNDNERIRTKAGFYYTFPKGTKFGLTDNTNYRYSVGYRINSIYYGSGWLKQDFILPNDAEVVICASKDPQTTETSVDDILSKLIIETPPEYQINELKGSLNTEITALQSALAYVETNFQSASRTYSVGEYFYSTTYNRLYRVTVATPQGTSFENHVAWINLGGEVSNAIVPEELTITEETQEIVHLNLNLVKAIRCGYIVMLNMQFDLYEYAPGSTYLKVGTIHLPRSLATEYSTILPSQDGRYASLRIRIGTDGSINFLNPNAQGLNCYAWYRGTIAMVLS